MNYKAKIRFFLLSMLSTEFRSSASNSLIYYSPKWILKLCSIIFDFPIRKTIRKSDSLFIHIPKNAGTTVSYQLYGEHLGHRSAEWYQNADPGFFREKYTFAIFRDPVERFVSAFEFLSNGGSEKVPASIRAVDIVRSFGNIFEFIAYYEGSQTQSFKNLDPVFHEQSKYVCDKNGKLIIDKLINIASIEGKIFQVVNTTIDMRNVENPTKSKLNYAVKTDARIINFVASAYENDYRLLDDLVTK